VLAQSSLSYTNCNLNIIFLYEKKKKKKLLSMSVPQGAVLSPFLWKTFLDPLLCILEQSFPMLETLAWADDDLLYFKFLKKNIEFVRTQLGDIFQEIHNWCLLSKARVNIEKSSLVLFQTHSHAKLKIQTPFGEIQSSRSLKFLGVTFDDKISFADHTKNLISNYTQLKHTIIPFYTRSLKLSPKFIHKIFITVIVPKFFFSCITWCSIYKSKTLMQKIQVFLNDCARYITRSISTTPINLLLALADIPTAHQLLQYQTLLCASRLLHQPNSKFKLLLQLPTKSKTTALISQFIYQQQISLTFSNPVDIFFQNNIHPHSISVNNIKIQFVFDNFFSVESNQMLFFTDGSKLPDHEYCSTGAAYVFYRDLTFDLPAQIHTIQLHRSCSHNDAEAWAILSVVLSIKHSLELHGIIIPCSVHYQDLFLDVPNVKPIQIFNPIFMTNINFTHNTCHIYTDSQVCLSGLLNPKQSVNWHVFCAILCIIQSLPLTFHLHWIPAHSGHCGNEHADKYAKIAAKSSTIPLITPVQITTNQLTKQQLKQNLAQQLHHNWNQITQDRHNLHNFFTCHAQFKKYLLVSHKFPYLNGILSNHLPTYAHLHRMHLSSGPACPFCLCEDDLQHYLFNCHKFLVQRVALLQELKLSEKQFTMDFIQQAFQLCNIPVLIALNCYIQSTKYNNETPSLKRKRDEIVT
jgi:Reverse transcriptase (RNA-dependent DNA polymerase)/RNase H